MKWETPARVSGSSREPAPIQKPSATERTPGTRSEITRSPVRSSVSRCFPTTRDRSRWGVELRRLSPCSGAWWRLRPSSPKRSGKREDHRSRDRPQNDCAEELLVSEQHPLRLLAEVVSMDQQEIPEHTEQYERHRQRHGRCGVLEGIQPVGDDRGCCHDRQQLVDELERVAVENRTRLHLLVPVQDELSPALREPEKERQQRRAENEPVRDRKIHGRSARDGTDDEQRGDDEDIEQDDVLELQRVRELKGKERRDQAQREQVECDADPERKEREDACRSERQRRRNLAAGDRTGSLDRMEPIEGSVADIVHEVGGARRSAERGEAGNGLGPAHRVTDPGPEDDSREDEEVLDPLSGTQRDEERTYRHASCS